MELLMASELYAVAERVALGHIQRLKYMPYSGVIGAAYDHAYSCLIHLYLSAEDYERAYHAMVMKAENYFKMLVYRTDLPEDFILSTYSLLASLARRLGREEDADRWNREYSILKARADTLAENETSNLQVINEEDLEQTNKNVEFGQSQWVSPPKPLPETNIEGSLNLRRCKGHTFDHEETTSEPHSVQLPFRSRGGGGGGGGWRGEINPKPAPPPRPPPDCPCPLP